MTKPRILLQLDTDDQASVFDSVVAVDAGVEHLLRHQGVTAANVRGLVHGAIFTRGLTDLLHTAIFIGGSDMAAAEAVLAEVRQAFFRLQHHCRGGRLGSRPTCDLERVYRLSVGGYRPRRSTSCPAARS